MLTPKGLKSLGAYPAPTPTTVLPFENRSISAMSSASRIGSYKGANSTPEARRILDVTVLKAAITTKGEGK
jgi:hypothetical protein